MGRRKVDPSKRVRAVRACGQCKYSKKRCDAALPCTNCSRRGLADLCSFDDSQPPQSSARPHPVSAPNKPGSHTSSKYNPSDLRTSSIVQSTNGPFQERTPAVSFSDIAGASSGSGATPHRTRSRLLSNAHGHQVYIGPSASLSFLQLVRETVAGSIGTSEFSQYAKRDQMLEAEEKQNSDSDAEANTQCPRRLEYAHNCLASTRGILGFLTKESTLSLIQNYPTSIGHNTSHKSAITCLVIAIGAQCTLKEEESAKDERAALNAAQRIVFADRLEDPSVDMIQSFLLLAFYMLGACKRNAAFMYLGVAARAAFALGLHSQDFDRLMPEESKSSRLNTWKSLVNLDLITSSILGRTAATAVSRSGDSESLAASHHNIPPEVLTLRSSYQLSLLVDEIVSILYGPQGVSVEAAERYLAFLNEWSDSLPANLRISTTPRTSESDSLARVVGSLHISCYYHFAVMLVSRPFLISHLVKSVGNTPGEGDDSVTSFERPDAATIAEMAQTCIKAAVLMAQTCSDVEEAGYLMPSMCLVKAWIFAAGLVLGFSMFATDKADFEVDEAFMGARNVLQKLSGRSLQAAHYADILKHLASAITKQRRMRRSSKRGGEVNAVDKILDFRSSTDNQQPLPSNAFESTNTGFSANNGFSMDDMAQNMAFNTYTGPSIDLDEGVFGWDSAALQFWDQFPFDIRGLETSDIFVP